MLFRDHSTNSTVKHVQRLNWRRNPQINLKTTCTHTEHTILTVYILLGLGRMTPWYWYCTKVQHDIHFWENQRCYLHFSSGRFRSCSQPAWMWARIFCRSIYSGNVGFVGENGSFTKTFIFLMDSWTPNELANVNLVTYIFGGKLLPFLGSFDKFKSLIYFYLHISFMKILRYLSLCARKNWI